MILLLYLSHKRLKGWLGCKISFKDWLQWSAFNLFEADFTRGQTSSRIGPNPDQQNAKGDSSKGSEATGRGQPYRKFQSIEQASTVSI